MLLTGGITAQFSGGVLAVNGTTGNDNIMLCQTNGMLSVRSGLTVASSTLIHIADGGKMVNSISDKLVKNVTMHGGAGNDHLLVGAPAVSGQAIETITVPVAAYGDTGSNVLYNNRGNDCTLYGGTGTNQFFSAGSFLHTRYWDSYNASQPAGAKDITVWDGPIQQVSSNCFFVAALSSVARNDSHLADRIRYEGGDNYQVGLYVKNAAGNPVLTYVPVTYSGYWTDSDTIQTPEHEFWATLYQDAFNKEYPTSTTTNPLSISNSYYALTGSPTTLDTGSSGHFNAGDARNIGWELDRGNNVSILTKTTAPAGSSLPMITNHWYTVDAVTPIAGTNDFNVTLRNPWGRVGNKADNTNGVFIVRWSQMTAWMDEYAVNTVVADPVAYYTDGEGGLYRINNLQTGQATSLGNIGQVLFDIAFSPKGQLYGIDGYGNLYTVNDLSTQPQLGPAVSLHLADGMNISPNALEFRSDGSLFAVAGNEVYQINPTTGLATPRFALPNGDQSSGDLVFDNEGNVFITATNGDLIEADSVFGDVHVVANLNGMGDVYGLIYEHGWLYGFRDSGGTDGQGSLYRIDPFTGAATEVATLSQGYGAYGATVFDPALLGSGF